MMKKRWVLSFLMIAVILAGAMVYTWYGKARHRLATIRHAGIHKIVVRVGAPLPDVTLFELHKENANRLIDVALLNAEHTGLSGWARADFVDLYVFDEEQHCILKIRLTSKDGATHWQSRQDLLAIAQSGRQYSTDEREQFFDELPPNLDDEILVVR